MGRRSRRRNMARAMQLINSPTAHRVMRDGWENMNFIPDPTRPGVAIAYRGPTEPSGDDLVMIRSNRGPATEGQQ